MVVAKRQGREKPTKIEQRKVRGPEWGPQVEQTALLASPIYIGQAQGEEKTKRASKGPGVSFSPARSGAFIFSLSLFSSRLLGRRALTPWGCIFLYFLNKTEGAVTHCWRAAAHRGLYVCCLKFLLWRDRTEENYPPTPLTLRPCQRVKEEYLGVLYFIQYHFTESPYEKVWYPYWEILDYFKSSTYKH